MKNKPIITALFFCFIILSASVTQAQTDTLKIETATGEPGQTVVLNIYLANHTTAISAFSMCLVYNSDLFIYEDVTALPRASEFIVASSNIEDSIRIIGYNIDSQHLIQPGSGDIVQLQVTIHADTPPGDYDITFSQYSFDCHMTDRFGEIIFPVLVDGFIRVTEITSTPENNNNHPLSFNLGDNYPNPFNSHTIIEYSVKDYSYVSLSIYNLLGQEVRSLVGNHLAPGIYSTSWDGKSNSGEILSSGVYFYKLSVNDSIIVKTLNYIK